MGVKGEKGEAGLNTAQAIEVQQLTPVKFPTQILGGPLSLMKVRKGTYNTDHEKVPKTQDTEMVNLTKEEGEIRSDDENT